MLNRIFTYKYYLKLVIGFVLFVSAQIIVAQEKTYMDELDLVERNRIVWKDQIPPFKGAIKKSNKGWLKRLILGSNDMTTMQKPVMAIPTEKGVLILDQGNGQLFTYENGKIAIPKSIRKRKEPFSALVAACLISENSILLTDSGTNRIYQYQVKEKKLSIWNEHIALERPTGIAFNEISKELWVVETAAHRISIFDSNGKRIRTIGERGVAQGLFNYPTSIWIDSKGTAYVVDALNYRIQQFDSEGQFKTMFGENGNGTGYFASPKGIATDSHGNIYVVDALFHTVQIFDPLGNYLSNFGEQGRDTGAFWMPSGIFIDKNDIIYVADGYNSRIQLFEPKIIE